MTSSITKPLSVRPKPIVLIILDGWGYEKKTAYNAIRSANTPQWDAWWETCPHALLQASGHFVGLPDNQMGNSEVGHMHIGAGRIISQDFTRINQAIESGEFASNPIFIKTIQDLKTNKKSLHVMGLLSPGGIHSHQEHLFAFLKLCHQQAFDQVCLHLFLDGRDMPPQSALSSIEALNQILEQYPVGRICSITGRYYAMDRDNRWERVEAVYHTLTEDGASTYASAEAAINAFYQKNIFDEFIPPTRIGSSQTIQDGDTIFFFNFRSDRARQLTQAFLWPDFNGFSRSKKPTLSHFVSMTEYAANLPTEIAFTPIDLSNTLGEIIAKHGLKQLRIAETEKYAHVTFFFNGGIETSFPGEDRILISSPKIATYDLKPEMSAPELTEKLVEVIDKEIYDVIICNYANADMVGHTGNLNAAIAAVECLDSCMKKVGQAIQAKGGALLITADHGNAELMFDETTGQQHTAHTCEPVPFLYVGPKATLTTREGSLIDVAPTVLTLLGIEQPLEMSGRSLLAKDHAN